MKRKKASFLNKQLSEEKGLSTNLTENLIEFYYKNVRTLLSELYHPRINITGLGLFIARSSNINKSIPKFETYLKNNDTSTYSAYYNKKLLEEKIECLYSIKDQIELEKKRKEEFLKIKNGFKKNME